MVKITPKTVTSFAMSGTCPTHARTEIRVRDLDMIIDEPVERGGTNQGPSPTETLLAALVGCTNVITHRVAEACEARIDRMTVEAEAKFDRRGVQLKEEIDVPFPEIKLTIDITTPASDSALATLKADLGKYCPLTKLLTQAGTKLDVVWNVTRS